MATGDVIVLHMGALHPVESLLTVLLAFGPVVALLVLAGARRREERAEVPRS